LLSRKAVALPPQLSARRRDQKKQPSTVGQLPGLVDGLSVPDRNIGEGHGVGISFSTRSADTNKSTNKIGGCPTIERTRPNAEKLFHSDFIETFEPARTRANGGRLQDGAQGQN
jgi:hypothetical protein